MSTRGVRQALHLKETHLIQTTGENINDVAIVSYALGEIIVELGRLATTDKSRDTT